ncbi:MAG: type IV secretory system conjugative DNA transfer family protein [Lachnospiraceae bacterium]|nr:type IV secretory system conjugative DNA transfer family protein [Lachnospiraceae bacterium]
MKKNDRRVMSKRIFAKGHIVSNDTRETGLNNNDCIIGPSGAGKTGGVVVPNLHMTEDSMVVADTKGLLYKNYKKDLRERGFRVECIDFVNPERSVSYNPLDYIRRYKKEGKEMYKAVDIKKMAGLLIPPEKSGRDDPFWRDAANNVLISLIAYVLEALPAEDQHLGSVNALYRQLSEEAGNLRRTGSGEVSFFADLEDEDPDSFAVKMYHMYRSTFPAEKCWSSIQQFVANALEVFTYPETEALFGRKSKILFSELAREKTILFVNISDTDRSMDNIVNVFYTQLLQSLCEEADMYADGRLKVPVRLILDDFAANVYIPDFDKITSVIRSREIYVSIILQSISQLDSMYKDGCASTIINNCDHMLYLGGQDPKTAEFISRKTGHLPEAIMNMPLDKAWFFERGKDPVLVDKLKPYSMDEEMDEPGGGQPGI